MPYLLGNYESGTEVRVNLIYQNTPPQQVLDNYETMLEGTVPEKENLKGKKAVLYFDTATSDIFYKYVDREKTEEELQHEQMSWLAKISTKTQVINNQLTEQELIKLGEMYPAWEVGVEYPLDDVISYHNELYKVIQTHTSQADWVPDSTASLYLKVAPAGVITEWVQPAGAHDAYSLDEQVTHNGKTWQSDIEANTYEPGTYGWTEI